MCLCWLYSLLGSQSCARSQGLQSSEIYFRQKKRYHTKHSPSLGPNCVSGGGAKGHRRLIPY